MTKLWMSSLVLVLLWVLGCGSTAPIEAPPESSRGDVVTSRPAPAPEAADEPLVNTLKWTTASEVDNFGFDIYRSLDEDGPFVKITDGPLPGAGTTDEPQRYIFVDDDIDPTRDYYYYIESISLGGIREVFSPTIKAPAKTPAPPTD